jgi:cysteinyl-tRNA synthetase
MAGSVGNVVNIVDLLQRHHPETVRFLLLATHYRSPIEYSEDRLIEVAKALQGFYRFFERYERITGESFYRPSVAMADGEDRPVAALWAKFMECMDDDFNTGGAVGVLFELLTMLNRFADAHKLEAPGAAAEAVTEFKCDCGVLLTLGQLLGLFWAPVSAKATDESLAEPLQKFVTELGGTPAPGVDALMQQLIQMRADARKAKNFAAADQIRKRLGELNVTLEDRPGGKTDWRIG